LLQASLSSAQVDFESLAALDAEIKSFKVGPNPYTWFTMEALEDTWRNLQKIISERDQELLKEAQRQEDNDRLRKEFARHANAFYQWLTETRYTTSPFTPLLHLFEGGKTGGRKNYNYSFCCFDVSYLSLWNTYSFLLVFVYLYSLNNFENRIFSLDSS